MGRVWARSNACRPRHRPINLSNASPDLAHFPFPLWRRLVSRHLRKPSAALFESSGQPAGDPRLREALAAYLARSRAVRCSPEQIVVVSGSQQALDLCARLLLDPGDEVAVEHPGYAAARQLFLAHGATLRAMRVTDEGASADELTNTTRLVHVTPSHQFPTGVSMSLPRRLALVEWARTRSAVVLEDDYDSEYRYDGPPLPAMQSLGGGANVIYIGTFSNVMFRGLRVGYVVVPQRPHPAVHDREMDHRSPHDTSRAGGAGGFSRGGPPRPSRSSNASTLQVAT